MAEKRIIESFKKRKVRVKSKKKVTPLSKQQVFHIGKAVMVFFSRSKKEVLNQQELEDFEL